MKNRFGKLFLLIIVGVLFLTNISLADNSNSGANYGFFAIGGSATSNQGYASSWSYPGNTGYQVFASTQSNVSDYGAWVAISEKDWSTIDNYNYVVTDSNPYGYGKAYVTAPLWSISYPQFRVDWKFTPLLNK